WFAASADFTSNKGDGPRFTRMTLDDRYHEEIAAPDYLLAVDEVAGGAVAWFACESWGNGTHGIRTRTSDGSTLVWDCNAFAKKIGLDTGECWSNTIVWDADRN